MGYLEIINVLNVSIIFHEPVNKEDAFLTHTNYVQDTFYYETFGCFYEAYIIKIIHELSMNCSFSDYTTGEYHQSDDKSQSGSLTTSPDPRQSQSILFIFIRLHFYDNHHSFHWTP